MVETLNTPVMRALGRYCPYGTTTGTPCSENKYKYQELVPGTKQS
jgi:hypothetical protein